MIVTITCNICSTVMGTIEKDDISAEDIAMYNQTMVCPAGHSNNISLPQVDEGDDS